MSYKIIYLNGFMAAGKTTIGPILANTLGWDFYDLDKLIEKETGKTIVQIFQESGENHFRELEAQTLTRLSKLENAVISLGGGTSAYNDNINTIRKTGKVIYLKASPESLFKRLRSKNDRPMINSESKNANEELRNKIDNLLKLRSPFYEQADLIINTDNYTLGVTVDKLAKQIKKELYERD